MQLLSFNNVLSSSMGQVYFGGLFRSINNARLVDGCAVEAEIARIEDNVASNIDFFGGIACIQPAFLYRSDGEILSQRLSGIH